ncbi:MAG TPA: glycosyltransferase [Longimicrobiales bacterium]
MTIVHLNTHSYGGAAVVARRLHLAALAAGIDSQLITEYGLSGDDTAQYTALRDARLRYALRERAAHPAMYRLGKFVQKRLQHRNLANRPPGYEIFSPLNSLARFVDCIEPFDPNVIHLHWVAGFVDHADFFMRNRHRRFVWTLHDMNPFTGGCHHADGCMSFITGCPHCPQLQGTIDPTYAGEVFQGKAAALAPLEDHQLVITAPSRWLLGLSQQSPITARFRHVHIANPSLDAGGSAIDMDETRRALQLPIDKKIVLFVSDNLRNPRKGVQMLFAAADRMRRKREIQLVGIGHRTDIPRGLDVKFTGRVTNDSVLRAYFSCADVLVNPSMMENSPLTVIEALSCGTPAIAFAVGGVAELINDGSGVVIPERHADALAEALDHVLFGRTYDRAAIRCGMAEHQPRAVLEKFKDLYMEQPKA